MGFATWIALFFAIISLHAKFSVLAEDAEFKDPNLVVVATFAASNILKNAEEFGIQNQSTLHRIMDAQIVPYPQPTPTQYMLTLELGNNCTSEGACNGTEHICEVIVLDEPWNKKQALEEDKTKCAEKEANVPLEFIDTSSTIASSLPLEDAATKAIAEKAVLQMGERRGGKHTLKHIGKVRKVMMEESNSNLYYLTLYISTTEVDSANEVCEVTMEEALPASEQTLQSLRCFTTGDNEGADKYGITGVPQGDLTSSLIRHAVLASLAIIDAESLSQFQLKVIGYSLADARVSVDSGARDLQLKLGVVPTLCIKRESSDEEDSETKACTVDVEREPSICSITLTQWPWVSDGYLFSDFDCESTNYATINEDLEAFADLDASAEGEDEAEVEDVSSNAVQAANRRETDEGEEETEEGEEEVEVEEEVSVARSAPCLGCPTEVDVNSPSVKEMADFVLSALENSANSDKVQSIARVIRATSQVVSGSLYMLTVELVDTNCLRNDNNDRSQCLPDLKNGQRRKCTVGIWDQPWLNSKQIRDPECTFFSAEEKSRSLKDTKAGVVTGTREFSTLSPDDEEVKEMANFALGRLDAFDDNSKKRLLEKVIEGTSHSVGRSKTFTMKIQVALANCPESSDVNDPSCQASSDQPNQQFLCDVQVLAQPSGARFAPKRLVDSKCGPAKSSFSSSAGEDTKDLEGEGSEIERFAVQQIRSPLGGRNPADSASPYIQSIADFATLAVNQRSNGNNMKLVRVVRAETQLVAGKKVTVDVEVGFTNCTKADAAESNCQLDSSQKNVICRVTVWDRVWLNDRRVTNMSCDSLSLSQEDSLVHISTETPSVDLDTSTSSIVGGQHQIDISSEIEAYSDFALAVIEEQSNGKEKLKVAKILASSVQIVEGKNIRLSLEIASTNCKRDQLTDDDCLVDEAKDLQVCNIQILDKPWLQERQVTNLNCQPKRKRVNERTGKSEDMDESPFVGYAPQSFRLGGKMEPIQKAHRSGVDDSQKPSALLGGFRKSDASDPAIIEIANFATTSISQTLSKDSANASPYSLFKIHSAEKQVVAGIKYKLELELNRVGESVLCKVTVIDQSWLSVRNVTNMTCFPQAFQSGTVGRKSKNSFGGYRPAAVNEPAVRDAASFAVSAMSEASPNARISLMKVKNAARQIASKQVNYKLTMQLMKNEATVICDAVVAEKSLRQLVSSSCRDKNKRKRSLDGGYNPVSTKDEKVKKMADFATFTIGQTTNEENLSVLQIVSAETQIVSGKNYKLTLKLKGESGIQTCDVVVYDQSWTKVRKLSSFKCQDPTKSRISRQQQVRPRRPIQPNNSELSIQPPSNCIGGYCPIDPNEKAVKEMTSFATRSLSRSINAGPLELIKIRSAERQVVAGFNYRLNLELNGTRGVVVCKVVVFDQSWTSTREIRQSQCEMPPPSIPQLPKPEPVEIPTVKVASTTVPAVTVTSTSVTSPTVTVASVPVPAPASYVSIDTANPTVQEMANFAVSTIGQSSFGEPVVLVKVISAATQVVAGINYKMALHLRSDSDEFNCQVVVFDQSATTTRQLLSSNCVSLSDLSQGPPPEPGGEEALSSIASRQSGAYFSIDPKDDQVVEMASLAQSLLSLSMNAGDLKMMSISSASKQVVDGFNYKLNLKFSTVEDAILSCDVVIHDNLKTRQMIYSSCVPSSRRKRSSDKITGGVTPMDVNDKKVQELSDFAVTAIRLRSNEPNAPNGVRVLKAGKQVVSGMLYTLELELSFVDCPQSSETCTRRQKCSVTIWEQVWLKKKEVTKVDCKDLQMKTSSTLKSTPQRQLLGGLRRVDPSSSEVQAHVKFALQAIQSQSNSNNLLDIVRIKNAATQTVSGKKIYLTVEVGETKCLLSNHTSQPSCPLDGQGDRLLCKIEIWTRPWLNERQITNLKCASLGAAKECFGNSCKRTRRSVELEAPRHSHHHSHHNHHSKNLKRTRKLKHMTAFRSFAKQFDKIYDTWDEFERRYKIYRANQEKIELLNRYEMGTAVYGDTPFSDWSAAEYKSHLVGLKPSLRKSDGRLPQATIPKIDLPDEFDWRNKSVVTPVKDQGSCGSCWAFSVTGNVEGVYAVRHGELLSLSEQELVDCDKLDSGCNGGLPENAYKAIKDLGGLEAENDYPYNAHQNTCKFNANITRVQVTGGVEISTNETEMAQWLVQNGPISIGINANAMQFYRGGVSHPWKVLCRPGNLDHGVLIVGYGVSNYPKFNKTLPYWIVKNSWGTRWGEQGYYRVFRGDGTCGLNRMCTSATLD